MSRGGAPRSRSSRNARFRSARDRRIGEVARLENGELELVVQHVIVLAGAAELGQEASARSSAHCDTALHVGVGGPAAGTAVSRVDIGSFRSPMLGAVSHAARAALSARPVPGRPVAWKYADITALYSGGVLADRLAAERLLVAHVASRARACAGRWR